MSNNGKTSVSKVSPLSNLCQGISLTSFSWSHEQMHNHNSVARMNVGIVCFSKLKVFDYVATLFLQVQLKMLTFMYKWLSLGKDQVVAENTWFCLHR